MKNDTAIQHLTLIITPFYSTPNIFRIIQSSAFHTKVYAKVNYKKTGGKLKVEIVYIYIYLTGVYIYIHVFYYAIMFLCFILLVSLFLSLIKITSLIKINWNAQ